MPTVTERGDALDGNPPSPVGCELPGLGPSLPSGVRVQIRNRFDGGWVSGFHVVAAQPDGGYLVRRLSDHSVLPTTFADVDLRLEPIALPVATLTSPPAVA